MLRIDKRGRITVLCLFVVIFITGLAVFRDYGVPWDEVFAHKRAILSWNYMFSGDNGLQSYRGRFHGPAFEILLYWIERTAGISGDLRSAYLMRHFGVFLLFYLSLITFYLLCRKRFNSWKIGILGVLFMVLSPRIFAQAFYNSKDIGFMSVFIISIYTLSRYLERKTFIWACIHAFVCAVLIDIRILGFIVVPLTLVFFSTDLMKNIIRREKILRKAMTIAVYGLLLPVLVVLFWPLLWERPLYTFIEALNVMAKYPLKLGVLYMGQHLVSQGLPWHYIPVWILVTTPVLYSICFLAGLCSVVSRWILKGGPGYERTVSDLIFLAWFFLPLSAVMINKTTLYDGWRHMLFIYPAFLVLALDGVVALQGFFSKRCEGKVRTAANSFLALAVLVSGVNIAWFMIRWHPYQNVYFNFLAGKDMKAAKKNFDLDYWGLSYRKVLEYILANDKRAVIAVYSANDPGYYNSFILGKKDRKRLRYVNNIIDADYFISNFRGHEDEYSSSDEYYSVEVNGAKIAVAYRLTPANKVRLLNDFGVTEGRFGNINEALAFFERARQSMPDYAETYNNLGFLYYKKGNLAKAEEFFEMAIERDPGDDRGRKNLEAIKQLRKKAD